MLTTSPASAPGAAWGELLTTWHTTWGVEIVLTALAALYLRTALHARGRPVIRTVSAMAALGVVVVTVDSGIGLSAPRSFPVGVVSQLLLTIVVPALWVAGRPLELLRRGSSARVTSVLDRTRDSAAARMLTAPLTALVVFTSATVLTRLTAFPAVVATSPALQVGEPLLWLGAGLLLFHTAVPLERPSRAPGLLLLVLATGVVAVVGGVLTASDLVSGAPAEDVHLGGTIMWAGGGALMVVILAVSGSPWVSGRPRSVRTEVR